MTFSQGVKSEILKSLRGTKGCCATSFLTAALKAIGSLSIGYKSFYYAMESDNHEFLTFCKTLCAKHFGTNCNIESSNVNAKGVAVYSCEFEGNIGEKLGLTTRDQLGAVGLCQDPSLLIPTKACCKRAFMQGLFVSCGSVVIPQADSDTGENKLRTKYHLELRLADGAFAGNIAAAFEEIPFHVTQRKNHVILYLKDSEKIADFLVYVNATNATLKLENVIIGRSMRNAANRQSNCISANIEKSVVAGEKQLEAIRILHAKGLFNSLDEPLKQVATLREQNPEANLEELAAKLGISKSGVNHRLKKLIELSQK